MIAIVVRRAGVAVVLAVGLSLATAGGLGAGGASVAAVDLAFEPSSVQIPAGGTVSWSNAGQTDHNVTADDGSFSSGNFGPGQGFAHTFGVAGTFSYSCTIHPQMRGTVSVVAAPPPAPESPPTGTPAPEAGPSPIPVPAAPSATG